jgi:hypothetical protein
MIKVEIVADSVNQQNDRLISMILTYPRIIHAEMMTHRMFSRNASSSRAVPVKKMIEAIRNNTFCPFEFQKAHKGMQGTEYFTVQDKEECKQLWLESAEFALQQAEKMDKKGISKQIINRILEPYQYYKVLITGSREGWDNFFSLRNPSYDVICATNGKNYYKSRKDLLIDFPDAPYKTNLEWLQLNKGQAEIHMMALAEYIWDAYNESTPKQLKAGEWHIPMKDKIEINKLSQAISPNKALIYSNTSITELQIKCSVAMAARTSYTVVGEEKDVDYANLIALHDRLLTQEPPHCFIEGTEILTDEGWKFFENLNENELIASVNINNGNFIGFEKAESFIEDDYEGNVYTYKGKNIDISVTPNHKLLGISVSKTSDRIRSYNTLEIIEPQQKISDNKTLGEREMIMFSAPNEVKLKDIKSYKEGQLLGFFLGDGSTRYKNSISFRLKKERKRSYITNLLNDLGIDFTVTLDKNNVYNIKASYMSDYTKFYDKDFNKYIPKAVLDVIIYNTDFILGLFDGLKNSDGSVKRNTWVYDTFSTPLKDNILFLCPLIGLTGVENPSYNHHRISFLTNNRILVNDPRKSESKVVIESYKGKIYCVETKSHGIIVRKNGKVLITHNSSPFEHCARAMSDEEYRSNINGKIKLINDSDFQTEFSAATGYTPLSGACEKEALGWCRNFKGFISYRHIIESK